MDAPLVDFMYPVFTRMPGEVTLGDSGAPCLSSAVISFCWLIGVDDNTECMNVRG